MRAPNAAAAELCIEVEAGQRGKACAERLLADARGQGRRRRAEQFANVARGRGRRRHAKPSASPTSPAVSSRGSNKNHAHAMLLFSVRVVSDSSRFFLLYNGHKAPAANTRALLPSAFGAAMKLAVKSVGGLYYAGGAAPPRANRDATALRTTRSAPGQGPRSGAREPVVNNHSSIGQREV